MGPKLRELDSILAFYVFLFENYTDKSFFFFNHIAQKTCIHAVCVTLEIMYM